MRNGSDRFYFGTCTITKVVFHCDSSNTARFKTSIRLKYHLYKINVLNEGSKIVKAWIAPHGSKDREKDNLKTDSATFYPVSLRIPL